MGRPKLSDEERTKRRAATVAKYHLKCGHIPRKVGRPNGGIFRKTTVVDDTVIVETEPKKIGIPYLPKNPTADDMREFVLALAENAAQVGSAPAMIAAAQTLQKEIDRWEKTNPPQPEPPKPRPRIPVAVEIESVKCPHCGKTFEV
ncbi:MAG: hypothetical protein MJ197_07775 [Bacteroidales bacterium]|nr:hypothetical protein [Bacteroidales bacterium]